VSTGVTLRLTPLVISLKPTVLSARLAALAYCRAKAAMFIAPAARIAIIAGVADFSDVA
jgi:hypothetical protein